MLIDMKLHPTIRTTLFITIPIVLVILFFSFCTIVGGDSMLPSLHNDDLIILNRFDVDPEVNDIIVFLCRNGKCSLYKNCQGCDDTLVKRLIKKDGNNWWVEGDNKNNSWDSRNYGWITPEDRIYYGSVLFVK